MANIFNYIYRKLYPFWIINFFGWMSLYLIKLFLYYYMELSDPKITYGFLLTELTGLITSGFLRIFYRKIRNYTRSIIKLAAKIVSISILMSIFWFLIDFIVSIPLQGFNELYSFYTFNILLRILWSHFYTLILWSTLYFVIKFWMESKTQKENAEKAILLAQSAQLQMLRYQVNPHFLFNSLSSLRALVRENQKKAEEMILQISKFLRYSLISKKNNQVRLKEEIEALGHYFEIERVRFGDKLVTEVKIDKAAEDLLIPSFLIHPIIENAIKYGMDTSTMPLKIKLSAQYSDSQLQINVINTGHWLKNNLHKSGTGTGLKNVKQRLDLAFPNKNNITIDKKDDSVNVKILIKY